MPLDVNHDRDSNQQRSADVESESISYDNPTFGVDGDKARILQTSPYPPGMAAARKPAFRFFS